MNDLRRDWPGVATASATAAGGVALAAYAWRGGNWLLLPPAALLAFAGAWGVRDSAARCDRDRREGA